MPMSGQGTRASSKLKIGLGHCDTTGSHTNCEHSMLGPSPGSEYTRGDEAYDLEEEAMQKDTR